MRRSGRRSTTAMATRWSTEIELVGAGGETVDLWRTLSSHGVADLLPNLIDDEARTLETTLSLRRGGARTIRIRAGRRGRALVEGDVAARDGAALSKTARRMLRLDADLSGFYEGARGSRPGLGLRRRRPNATQPDGFRGRDQDDLHHELRLVGHGADGNRSRV